MYIRPAENLVQFTRARVAYLTLGRHIRASPYPDRRNLNFAPIPGSFQPKSSFRLLVWGRDSGSGSTLFKYGVEMHQRFFHGEGVHLTARIGAVLNGSFQVVTGDLNRERVGNHF